MYKILVADDEPIERQVIDKKINSFFGDRATVITAENGIAAVDAFSNNDCQIAVLDIEMPGMNGLEAAEKIRDKNKNCSIIFLTAFDDFSYAQKAIKVRAIDYLLKPASDVELYNILEEAFRICDKSEMAESSDKVSAGGAAKEPSVYSDADRLEGDLIREIKAYIDMHFAEDIALFDIAGYFGYSDVYFCKLFKQNFGKNFITYLNEYRMARAKELLDDVSINIKDVGMKVGYRDANYFTRIFKRMVGVTPSDYRSRAIRND